MKKIFIVAFALCVSIIMVQPLVAGETGVARMVNQDEAISFQPNAPVYGNCAQVYSAVGSAWTWCLDTFHNVWWGTSDDRCGNMMMHAEANNSNWVVNVYNMQGNWDWCWVY